MKLSYKILLTASFILWMSLPFVSHAALGDILYGSSNPSINNRLTIGASSTCITSTGSVPIWYTCGSGGASTPLNTNPFSATYFTATSTTATSTFPIASFTIASTTNLYLPSFINGFNVDYIPFADFHAGLITNDSSFNYSAGSHVLTTPNLVVAAGGEFDITATTKFRPSGVYGTAGQLLTSDASSQATWQNPSWTTSGATSTNSVAVASSTCFWNGTTCLTSGGTPAGSTGQLQYNNGGVFGATSSPIVGYITATSTTATSTFPVLRDGEIADQHSDGSWTYTIATTSSDTGRGIALLYAIYKSVSGDSLYLASSTFDLQTGNIDLSKNGTASISIHGAGKYNTIIKSSCVTDINYGGGGNGCPIIQTANNSETTDLSIIGYGNGFQYPWASLYNAGSANSTLRNVYIKAGTDGVFFNNLLSSSPISTITLQNVSIFTDWDTILFETGSASSSINIYDSDFHSDGTLVPGGNQAHGMLFRYGTSNIYNSQFFITGTSTNQAIANSDNGACYYSRISLYGDYISTANGTSNVDLWNANSYYDDDDNFFTCPNNFIGVTSNTIYSPIKTTGYVNGVNTISYVDTNQILTSIGSVGTLGKILQSTGTTSIWVATSSLGISGGSSLSTNPLQATYFTATSTTATSTFPNLNATNFAITGLSNTLLGVDGSGNVIATTSSGTNYWSQSGATTTNTVANVASTLGVFGTLAATSTTGTSTFAGAVGIGTTTPSNILEVAGNEYLAGTLISTSTATSSFSGTLIINNPNRLLLGGAIVDVSGTSSTLVNNGATSLTQLFVRGIPNTLTSGNITDVLIDSGAGITLGTGKGSPGNNIVMAAGIGGASTAVSVINNSKGGNFNFTAGQGGQEVVTVDGNVRAGAGGDLTFTSGPGGKAGTYPTGTITGGNAGNFNMTAQAGGDAGNQQGASTTVGNVTGGAGGNFTATGGNGGVAQNSLATNKGGAGGTVNFVGGNGGGATGGTTGIGGNGGGLVFTGGNGATSNSATSTNTGGNGGSLTFTPGKLATGGTDGNTTFTDALSTTQIQITDNLTTIGTTTISKTIKLTCYTVATLPAGAQGMMSCVTDALAPTFLGSLTGGSTTYTPVTYNGTAWVSY